eukprot:scaffold5956_cov385-Prasinococcus_capsulatus_cf.AAC.6
MGLAPFVADGVANNTVNYCAVATCVLSKVYDHVSEQWLGFSEQDQLCAICILMECLQPYVRALDSWLFEGKVTSPEFYIAEDEHIGLESAQFWTSRFVVRKWSSQHSCYQHADGKDMCPTFLVPLASKILSAGRSVRLQRTSSVQEALPLKVRKREFLANGIHIHLPPKPTGSPGAGAVTPTQEGELARDHLPESKAAPPQRRADEADLYDSMTQLLLSILQPSGMHSPSRSRDSDFCKHTIPAANSMIRTLISDNRKSITPPSTLQAAKEEDLSLLVDQLQELITNGKPPSANFMDSISSPEAGRIQGLSEAGIRSEELPQPSSARTMNTVHSGPEEDCSAALIYKEMQRRLFEIMELSSVDVSSKQTFLSHRWGSRREEKNELEAIRQQMLNSTVFHEAHSTQISSNGADAALLKLEAVASDGQTRAPLAPPALLIEQCLLRTLESKCNEAEQALVSAFLGSWNLVLWLRSIRAVYLCGAGDAMHEFCTVRAVGDPLP